MAKEYGILKIHRPRGHKHVGHEPISLALDTRAKAKEKFAEALENDHMLAWDTNSGVQILGVDEFDDVAEAGHSIMMTYPVVGG